MIRVPGHETKAAALMGLESEVGGGIPVWALGKSCSESGRASTVGVDFWPRRFEESGGWLLLLHFL